MCLILSVYCHNCTMSIFSLTPRLPDADKTRYIIPYTLYLLRWWYNYKVIISGFEILSAINEISLQLVNLSGRNVVELCAHGVPPHPYHLPLPIHVCSWWIILLLSLLCFFVCFLFFCCFFSCAFTWSVLFEIPLILRCPHNNIFHSLFYHILLLPH